MKQRKFQASLIVFFISTFVFIVSFISLIYSFELDRMINVIGIRIATLIVAYASFCSTSIFSYLIYMHNRTTKKANDDANKRAELFRDLQFASSNYSIIEFNDRMLIYNESERYIEQFIGKKTLRFHMLHNQVQANDVLENPNNYNFLTLRIPFKVIEGKVVANIMIDRLKFERNGINYYFIPPSTLKQSQAFLLYNEFTKRNNVIINLIYHKNSDFFNVGEINDFSKIKINLKISSLLGVEVKGISELYFTNPEKKELDGALSYKINSSNFSLTSMPKISDLFDYNNMQ